MLNPRIGALALAIVLFGVGLAHAGVRRAVDEPAKVTATWPTGNTIVRPFTCSAGTILLSGDKTAELWTTDGQRLWQTPLPHTTHFRPRTDGRVVTAGGRTAISVLDAQTGRILWTYTATEDEQLSVPLIADGKVIVGRDSWLKAFDAQTGRELWEFAIVLPRVIAYPPIAYEDKWVLLGPGDGNLYALDIKDGSLVWKNDTGKKKWQYLRQLYITQDDTGRDILVAGGYKDDLYGIDVATGEQLWRFYSGNFINSHLVVDDETYFWSPKGWVYALEIKYGEVRWRHLTDDHHKGSGLKKWGHFMAELVADEDRVFALDMNFVLHLLDRRRGDEVRAYQLPFKTQHFICTPGDGRTAFTADRNGAIVKLSVDP